MADGKFNETPSWTREGAPRTENIDQTRAAVMKQFMVEQAVDGSRKTPAEEQQRLLDSLGIKQKPGRGI